MSAIELILFGCFFVCIANIFIQTNKSKPKSFVNCPHCNTTGFVYAKTLTVKKGISGGKATGAILTGGLSILATGLSRKEERTKLHCKKCDMTWII